MALPPPRDGGTFRADSNHSSCRSTDLHVLPSLPMAATAPGHCRARGGDRRPAGMAGGGARTREYRRRRRAGDRRRSQYLDVAEGRRPHERHARPAAGLADGGVLRGILQEPARPGRRRAAEAAGVAAIPIMPRGGSTRSAPASSSMRPVSSSPTTTSSPMPMRSTSSSMTAPNSPPNSSERTARAISRCCACIPTNRSRR